MTDPTIILFLMLATIFTSVISAIAGLAGGVTLLSIFSFFFKYEILIPIHGVVQLLSNGSRSFILRKNINKKLFFIYLLGAPIGAYAGKLLLPYATNTQWPMILLALLIFYTVLNPKIEYQLKIPNWGYFFVGIITGLLAIFTGAVGPFLTNFFIRDDMKKEEIVATLASFQIITHILKIPVFLSFNFPYQKYALLFCLLAISSSFGSYLGVKLLKKISMELFTKLIKIFLFFSGVKILYQVLVPSS